MSKELLTKLGQIKRLQERVEVQVLSLTISWVAAVTLAARKRKRRRKKRFRLTRVKS